MSQNRKGQINNRKGFIIKIRESRPFKGLALCLALNLMFEMIQPTVSLALTEGPSQPEVQSFEPIGTTQMVDMFSGDFNYNIPLFNLPGPNGGYPINLAYHAGISMDDEASWVGLGWNINAGALNRSKRGLPDEFISSVKNESTQDVNHDGDLNDEDMVHGDFIETKFDMKESWTIGASVSKDMELFGGDLFTGQSLSASIYYNNYRGLGMSVGFNARMGQSPYAVGLSLDSENGLGVSGGFSLGTKGKKNTWNHSLSLSFDGKIGTSYSLTGNTSVSTSRLDLSDLHNLLRITTTNSNSTTVGAGMSFARGDFNASIPNKINSYGFNVNISFGDTKATKIYKEKTAGLFFNIQDYDDDEKRGVKRPVVGYAANDEYMRDDYTKDFIRMNDGQVTKETVYLPHSVYANDYYSSTGQGFSSSFRGHRNDIGKVHDAQNKNTNWSVSLSIELEVPDIATDFLNETVQVLPDDPEVLTAVGANLTSAISTHTGIGVSVGYGFNSQGAWNQSGDDGKNNKQLNFLSPETNGTKENFYYKVHGEPTIQHPDAYDHINQTDLALVKFEEQSSLSFLKGKRNIVSTNNQHLQNERDPNAGREVRNTLVHSLKNGEVYNLGEFQIKYYDLSSSLSIDDNPNQAYNRSTREMNLKLKYSTNESVETYVPEQVGIGHHDAGFKVLNDQGSYYVYGLPAYNKKEVQNLFSIVGSETTGFDPQNSDVVDVNSAKQKQGKGQDDVREINYEKAGTHKFISKTTTSPYAHSYMLTSVQGADYVDIKNDGPTDDDLGYWVKFDYGKSADNYKWRAPYYGANYTDGNTYTREDDKASYSYGEKELWYLTKVETKTHIAVFNLSSRTDMVEAEREFINEGDQDLQENASGLKIDNINVYEKKAYQAAQSAQNPSQAIADLIPIQTVHFEYDYSLCKGVLNKDVTRYVSGGSTPNASDEGGKLTLKKVWFTSQGSERGALNKYEFDYEDAIVDPAHAGLANLNNSYQLVNPDYRRNSYDSWSNYSPWRDLYSGNAGYGQHTQFPYVNQSRNGWEQEWMQYMYSGNHETKANKAVTKTANDLIASSWSLRKIKLPSGGEIKIEYESDDYSHVQHKVANQMFKIVKMGDDTKHNELYHGQGEDFYNTGGVSDEKRRRIYFKLEKPLLVDAGKGSEEYAKDVYDAYVEPIIEDESGTRNLYFKAKTKLVNNDQSNVDEYIRGYLPLEKGITKYESGATHHNCGVLLADETDGNGSFLDSKFDDGNEEYYAIGYVTIQAAEKKNGADYFSLYHPMALAAWTHMQTNTPELLNPSSTFSSSSSTPTSPSDVLNLLGNVMNAIPATAASYGAIRPWCRNQEFARTISLNNSCIRLSSPDKSKFGGGHRVKSISITDNWNSDTGGTQNDENSNTYGQHYDYTIQDGVDENGDPIYVSSGVAQYEPQAGGDENALKYPMYFWGKNKMITNNNLFTEAPINENMFPGASVGYRQVTVTSLNTHEQLEAKANNTGMERGRTTGITVHEFYTSKEFPTIVSKSILSKEEDTKDVFNLPIPIPLIGSIKRNYYHGTQAFKIDLNDMHGKPKSVKAYETNGYVRGLSPITESSYEYQSIPQTYQGELVNRVDSKVNIMPNDGSDIYNSNETRYMGVEAELFTDQREFKSFNSDIGLNFNNDLTAAIPIFTLWPSINDHKTMFRTYVTNKVVHRVGILKKSKQRDLQTVNESEIIAYDEKSGVPMLTKVTNEFGDDFYSYNIPAYYKYELMGHAYENINYNFIGDVTADIDNSSGTNGGNFIHFTPNSNELDNLVRGDELLLSSATVSSTTYGGTGQNYKGYFLGFEYNNQNKMVGIVHFPEGLAPSDVSGPGSSMVGWEIAMKVIRSGHRNHYSSMAAGYTTKGLLEDHTVSGEEETVITTDLLDNHEIVTKNIKAGTVLAASASVYTDNWHNNDLVKILPGEGYAGIGSKEIDNPYLTGNSGIWRPLKSYSYVGERSANASMTDNTDPNKNPDLKNDGIFSGHIPRFSWEIGNYEDYVANWEWVNEVTRFSGDSYELENRNRLGIHSSALYGYDNSLSIAVGGNSSYFELGAVDFEKSDDYWNHGISLISTNMNFHNSSSSNPTFFVSDVISMKNATYDGTDLTIYTDVLLSEFSASDYEPEVSLAVNRSQNALGGGNDSQFLNGTFNTSQTVGSYIGTDGSTYAKIVVNPHIDNAPQQNLPSLTSYTGKLRMLKKRDAASENALAAIEFTSIKAHTGVKSMKVNSTMMFAQQKLTMIKDKKYILSMWVSRDNVKQVTFSPENLIALGTNTVGATITVNSTSVSKIIEGWQKVDIEFEADLDDAVLTLQFVPGASTMYVDDIRFSPKTGGITTSVYDPDNFRLRASLNVDNYATLYFYNEEGNLTLTKQETEEGIFTVSESRGHVSEN